MRAAAIFGLGTSSQNLDAFREYSATEWMEECTTSSADADRPSANPETFHYFCCVVDVAYIHFAVNAVNRMLCWLC